MSNEIFKALKCCDDRDIEILIVCRKDCLKNDELNKLNQLKHLTLLSHPNLHSKIYLNEKDIIIGSMNLYDYSEKFNREAGILISNGDVDIWHDDPSEDCKKEIKEIISGSKELKVSSKVLKKGVDFYCLATEDEVLLRKAQKLSQQLITKTFVLKETREGYCPTCVSFYDNIDVAISNRVSIMPNYRDDILVRVFDKFEKSKFGKFKPFRVYSSIYHKMFTVYAPKGEYIEDYIYTDRQYAKQIEEITSQICEILDTEYRFLLA